MSRIAIIDLGTNTFHLLVVDISATDIQIIQVQFDQIFIIQFLIEVLFF